MSTAIQTRGNTAVSLIGWLAVAVLGAVALGIVALSRGEPVNAVWLVIAAVCIYLIAYRFYALFIADKVLRLDARAPTPAVRHNDGLDYVPTNKYVLFGHHFAAIAGAGPLVGPVLAAQMGYLPGTLWILARRRVRRRGAGLHGPVHLDAARRPLARRHDPQRRWAPLPGVIALFGVLMIMIILLAVLALIVVKALAGSPWGTFTVFATIPIAMLMGVYGRFLRPRPDRRDVGDRLRAADGGDLPRPAGQPEPDARAAVHLQRQDAGADHADRLRLRRLGAAGVAAARAARLPLDLPQDRHDLAARDRHPRSSMPDLKMPAVSRFVDGTGPVFSGSLFPFLFITIACGAVSGLPRADRVRHHAEDDREREPDPLHRLRRDADGDASSRSWR